MLSVIPTEGGGTTTDEESQNVLKIIRDFSSLVPRSFEMTRVVIPVRMIKRDICHFEGGTTEKTLIMVIKRFLLTRASLVRNDRSFIPVRMIKDICHFEGGTTEKS